MTQNSQLSAVEISEDNQSDKEQGICSVYTYWTFLFNH